MFSSLDSPAGRVAGKRKLRKGLILNALRSGSMSRVEIARHLAFNLRSVSLLVDELIADNLVTEQAGRTTPSGRRPIPVTLNASAASVLGIDIGRTSSVASVMNLDGTVHARTDVPSSYPSDPAQQTAWVLDFVASFLDAHRHIMPPLAGAGLAAEGLVFHQVRQTSYLQVAEPLRKKLQSRLKVPVAFDSDSRFLALGEQWFGRARGLTDFAVLNVTDGLGLACVLDGKLLSGRDGWAGEIGHVPLGQPGVPCFCGSRSCLENTASASGLVRMAIEAGILKRRKASALDDLIAEARAGNGPALNLFDRFAQSLALAVTLVMDLFNPEAVILGGKLARHADLYLPAVQAELQRLVPPFVLRGTRLLVSQLCEEALSLGTCAKVLNQIYDTSHVKVDELL
jgi:predicted NBD/HSP70 family sugar kinase